MNGECHGHIFMDGISYPEAVKRHQAMPDENYIRKVLSMYKNNHVHFFRDGGDCLNVSTLAKQLAPEYSIDYRTPAFAIHRKDYYGGIVGHSFSDEKEYCKLIDLADSQECDFIKLMVSGILSYEEYGVLSCPSLPDNEIKALIHIAHAKGYSVMIHVNGDAACRSCIESGADSIEHGFFMSSHTLRLLSKSNTIWVPTIAPSYAAIGAGRFDDELLRQITMGQMEQVRCAKELGCKIAAGSDAGAYRVLHTEGIKCETELLKKCGLSPKDIQDAEAMIQSKFKRN